MMRDENDVLKLLTTFDDKLLCDPFHIPDDNETEFPLSNFATGVVIPDGEAKRLLEAAELGIQSMQSFLSTRGQTQDSGKNNNFWDPIHKLKIKSFSSIAKTVSMKSQKENVVSINVDRKLFGRLLVGCQKQRYQSERRAFL